MELQLISWNNPRRRVVAKHLRIQYLLGYSHRLKKTHMSRLNKKTIKKKWTAHNRIKHAWKNIDRKFYNLRKLKETVWPAFRHSLLFSRVTQLWIFSYCPWVWRVEDGYSLHFALLWHVFLILWVLLNWRKLQGK